ncbi:MAG TPA: DedA family protein [Acidimicrobiales bacterium]|nr:DedA family protein [Acidimicrobiales bacterium]
MQSFLSHSGYLALVVLAFVEACCIPIPSEVTFGFAGAIAGGLAGSDHHFSLALVIVLGTVAELAGSLVAFTVGRVGGRPLVEKLGRYLLITRADLDRAERFFNRRGEIAVPIGRAAPILRAFVSLVAGIAEMSVGRFLVFSLIGTAVYASAVAGAGYALAGQWHKLIHGLSIAGYLIVAVVVIAIAVFVLHRLSVMRRERESLETADPPA